MVAYSVLFIYNSIICPSVQVSTETSEHAQIPEEWEGSAPKQMKESENPDQRWGHFC